MKDLLDQAKAQREVLALALKNQDELIDAIREEMSPSLVNGHGRLTPKGLKKFDELYSTETKAHVIAAALGISTSAVHYRMKTKAQAPRKAARAH